MIKHSMNAKKCKTVCFITCAIILVFVIALNVVIGLFSAILDRWVVGYKSGSNEESRMAGVELAGKIQCEGTVLAQNQNNVLPLDKNIKKVNVFGWASVDWVYSGSGSGRVKGTMDRSKDTETQLYDLFSALENYGVEYNTELSKMYKRFESRRYMAEPLNSASKGTLHSFNYEFSRLYEPSINDKAFYSQSMLENALEFSDTAFVVIGRVSGESNDSPKIQYKKNSASDKIVIDEARTYLEISTEEEQLLSYVGANYKNVVVIVNSTNVMELGFLETIKGLDSCLIVATTGASGALEIPKILWGDSSPSGRTADTYAYDLSTSSTYVNTGSGLKGADGQGQDTTNFYTNGAGLYPTTVNNINGSSSVPYSGVAYTDYAESIYVGYKWYETADSKGFWNSEKAKAFWNIKNGYDDVVQLPFGFGLSYTEFEWKIESTSFENEATVTEKDEIEIRVLVTNKGEKPGQDVVQLYYTAPYTDGGIEKASVNLIAFGKTQKILKPGESETVILRFKVEDMKSYDCYDLNKNNFAGYELEHGFYTLSLRTDAHNLATEKIVEGSSEFKLLIQNDIKIKEDSSSGNTIENRFTGNNTTDGVAIDGNSDHTAKITYLSRSDFEGTFPYKQADNRAMTDSIKALNLYTNDMAKEWDARHQTEEIVTNADNGNLVYSEESGITDLGLRLGDDKNYNDSALWNSVLNQLTEEEMQNLVLHSYTKTMPLKSIGKPETTDLDGPNQMGSFDNGLKGQTGFSSIVLAQTWNTQLAYDVGLTVGKEAANEGVSGWYGPAVNLHRSPFGGRNYEYYSEDAYLSGIMCAYEVKAAKNAGVYSFLKHLCLYESESGRDGMYNWITEQALRETYIKPFEVCVKEGGATGIMTSYGRIGAVWTGGSEALLTEVVRNEWGFKGAILTDYADHHEFMNGDQMLRAGGDLWMDGWNSSGKFHVTDSSAFRQVLQNANKHVIFAWLNALATNHSYNAKVATGEIPNGTTILIKKREPNFRWYIPVIVIVDIGAVVGCSMWLYSALKKKDEK